MPGQTLSDIRGLLAAHGLSPRHRFGQNFLIDLNLMRKLVDAADLRPGDVVLEVGAGTGSLTEILLERGVRVIAVEIDHGFQELLRERFGHHPRVTLVACDVLSTKHRIAPNVLDALCGNTPDAGGSRKLVANLPYQIATPLLMELLLQPHDPPRSDSKPGPDGDEASTSEPLRPCPNVAPLVCTLQKEVAERFLAPAKTGGYGPISVIAQTLAEIERIATIPSAAFWPRPKVESAMLAIRPRSPLEHGPADIAAFAAFVRRGFLHRRKTLGKAAQSWNEGNGSDALEQAGISSSSRPGDLSPSEWQHFFAAAARP